MKTLKSIAIVSMLSILGVASAGGVYVCPYNLPDGANVSLISSVDGYIVPDQGGPAVFKAVVIRVADGAERVSCEYDNYASNGAIVGGSIAYVGGNWQNGSTGPYCLASNATPCTFSYTS